MVAVISLICLAVAAVGCFITLVEAREVRRFRRSLLYPSAPRSAAAATAATGAQIAASTAAASGLAASAAAGATLLKPLHGAEPGLDENLLSFVNQAHDGPVQLLFGVADAADPAAAAVRRLQQQFPRADIELVVTGRASRGNAKIANLAGMSGSIRHDTVVMSDSDIRVEPGYLRLTLDALGEPGVGLVTWLYRGEAQKPSGVDAKANSRPGVWALLSAMAIDYHFFPSVLLGLAAGRGRPCVGATMAFSKDTLAAIGGFAAFADHLADDHAIGEAVRKTGQQVVVAPGLVAHGCDERSAGPLVQHELRWARTIRSIDPSGFFGSVVLHPLPFALAGALLRGFDAWSACVLAAALLCRLGLQWSVDRAHSRKAGDSARRWALGPVRDMLSFAVFCASFLNHAVVWRGRRYRVRADGTMVELKG